jgi:3-oxoacyl-[acyl-carrier-protein] synthase II
MNAATILGLSQVSAVGTGVEALRRALCGARGQPEWIACDPARPEERIAVLRAQAGDVASLAEPGILRRLDGFALKALLAAKLAVRDAGEPNHAPERTGLIVATGHGPLTTAFGFLDQLIDKGDNRGSPVLFASSLHNAPAAQLSLLLGVRGPLMTLTGFAHVVARALGTALQWLDRDVADRVLVVAADEFHPVVGYGVQARGHGAPDGTMRPFALERPSLVPGETFVALVLERAGNASPRWGQVSMPRAMRGPLPPAFASDATTPLFLAARGDPDEAAAYAGILPVRAPVAAYSPLWGANPTSEAMTMAAAAMSIAAQTLYASPDDGELPAGLNRVVPGPAALPTIHCCVMSARGTGMLISITRSG